MVRTIDVHAPALRRPIRRPIRRAPSRDLHGVSFDRLGAFAARRRWWIVAAWALLLLAAVPLAPRAPGALSAGGFILDDLESARAKQVLEDEIGLPPSALVIVHSSDTLRAGTPEWTSAVAQATADIPSAPHVERVVSHLLAPRQVSADGRLAYDIVLLDLPPDEDPALIEAFRAAGLANVCLAAPTTTTARKTLLARASRGFLYYVCRLGVTGERTTLPADLARQVASLKAVSQAPVCIGFGISTPEQAAEAASHGDGAIVGSHLVRMIETHRGDRAALVAALASRAGELAAAVHAI